MEKKILLIPVALLLAISLVATGCPAPAPAPPPPPTPAPSPLPPPAPAPLPKPEPIELSFVTSDVLRDNLQVVMGWDLLDRIEERTEGAIRFKFRGRSEVIPSREQMEAVRNGVVDMSFTVPAYGAGIVYEGQALSLARRSNKELRESGFFDLLRQIYREENLYFVTRLDPSDWEGFYQLYLTDPIQKPEDLKGRKMRVIPTYIPIIKAFGAVPVSIPAPEIYTAVDRGIVDGFGFPAASIFDYKLEEVAKYFVTPGFGQVQMSFIINLDSWNAIPKDIQKVIHDTVIEIEPKWVDEILKIHEGLFARLQAAGVQQIQLSPEDGERYVSVWYSDLWADIIAKSPEFGPKLKELAAK